MMQNALLKAFLLFIFTSFSLLANAQSVVSDTSSINDTTQSKKIQILNADKFSFSAARGEQRWLVGNVALQHEKVLMYCDSALVYKETNSFKAYGNVYVNQNDSVEIYCDSLFYYGNEKKADLFYNIVLTDRYVSIFTNFMNYEIDSKIGSYYKGGKVTKDDMVITSNKGFYYGFSERIFFRDKVLVVEPRFTLNSDTLQYLLPTDEAIFHEKTVIQNKESTIYCDKGKYNTKTLIAEFGNNTSIINPPNQIYADSLYYDQNKSLGYVFRYFEFYNQEKNTSIIGTHAVYREEPEYIFADERPLLIQNMENDSLFLRADTLVASLVPGTKLRQFIATGKVKIFKSDLQGNSDSLYYAFTDSSFQLFKNPILWSKESQISADTIFISTQNNQLDSLICKGASFLLMQESDSLFFNQVASIDMLIQIDSSKIQSLFANANAQCVYYAKNEKTDYIGANKANCSNIFIDFDKGEPVKVKLLGKPDAIFHPIEEIESSGIKLDNFRNLFQLRPSSKNDL